MFCITDTYMHCYIAFVRFEAFTMTERNAVFSGAEPSEWNDTMETHSTVTRLTRLCCITFVYYRHDTNICSGSTVQQYKQLFPLKKLAILENLNVLN